MDLRFAQPGAHTQDLTLTRRLDSDGLQDGQVLNPSIDTDFLVMGVQVDDRVLPAQRPAAKLLQLLIQQRGHPGDLSGGDLGAAQLLGDLTDLARGDAHDVHLGDGQLQRLFRAAALFQRLGVKRQPSNLRDLQSELSHARGDLLVFVAIGVAPPLACPLVGLGSQKLRSLHSHRQVEEFFQHLAKGLGSFFDQLLQDLYSRSGALGFSFHLMNDLGESCPRPLTSQRFG